MLDREFERYKGGPNEATATRLHVTISPQLLIRLNRNVFHQMGKPDAVYLNFSRTKDIIAIEPTSPRLAAAFPLIPDGRGWRINSTPFCRHFGIRIDMTLKFIKPEIEGNALYLKLGETVSAAYGPRKKKK